MKQLRILESQNEIHARILFEASQEVDKLLRRNSSAISRKISRLLADRIHETPEMKSILGGKLKADFGLSDQAADEALERVTSLIRENTVVRLNKNVKNGLFYSITISLLPNGLTPFFDIRYDSINDKGESHPVDWMEWLLTKGVTIINDEFFVMYGPFRTSRSGEAIMVKGGTFRVDPEFAGTEQDNFIVNTVKRSYQDMIGIIGSYL